MKNYSLTKTFLILVAFGGIHTASAHIGYNGRNLGVFQGSGTELPVVISNQSVTSDYGWADGTDTDFGDSHKLRAFRIRLDNAAIVTIQVAGVSFSSLTALEMPAFSIFGGLAHVSPALGDHDTSVISALWMDTTYGTGNWEGAFNALGDWKIGNDDGITFADLSSFTYIGNAADGSSANFGSAPGISGDGNQNRSVTGTFSLAAGDYSIFVGGGLYSGSNATTSYGFSLTATVVPEPSTMAFIGVAFAAFLMHRLRRRRAA